MLFRYLKIASTKVEPENMKVTVPEANADSVKLFASQNPGSCNCRQEQYRIVVGGASWVGRRSLARSLLEELR